MLGVATKEFSFQSAPSFGHHCSVQGAFDACAFVKLSLLRMLLFGRVSDPSPEQVLQLKLSHRFADTSRCHRACASESSLIVQHASADLCSYTLPLPESLVCVERSEAVWPRCGLYRS